MIETLQILCKGIQQRGDFDVFEQHKSYGDMITKIQSTLDVFLSKNLLGFTCILFYFIFNSITKILFFYIR
jgi:hypothetical protein